MASQRTGPLKNKYYIYCARSYKDLDDLGSKYVVYNHKTLLVILYTVAVHSNRPYIYCLANKNSFNF